MAKVSFLACHLLFSIRVRVSPPFTVNCACLNCKLTFTVTVTRYRNYKGGLRTISSIMILPTIKVAGSAVAAVLAFCSARNMIQTTRILSNDVVESTVGAGMRIQDELAETVSSHKGLASLIDELKTLSRKEALCLFASCPSVKLKDIEGDWNLMLLENNGIVMTQVASFMTNQLFSKGHTFLGKSFNCKSGMGINMFTKETGDNTQFHEFDFSVEHSRMLPSDDTASFLTGTDCIALKYGQYQPIFSPWKTMRDELRTVPLPEDSSCQLMIGMGCMAWSGGLKNGTPFCLWRKIQNRTSK